MIRRPARVVVWPLRIPQHHRSRPTRRRSGERQRPCRDHIGRQHAESCAERLEIRRRVAGGDDDAIWRGSSRARHASTTSRFDGLIEATGERSNTRAPAPTAARIKPDARACTDRPARCRASGCRGRVEAERASQRRAVEPPPADAGVGRAADARRAGAGVPCCRARNTPSRGALQVAGDVQPVQVVDELVRGFSAELPDAPRARAPYRCRQHSEDLRPVPASAARCSRPCCRGRYARPSTSATFTPASAKRHATAAPVMPPPMTATSTSDRASRRERRSVSLERRRSSRATSPESEVSHRRRLAASA